MENTMRDAEEKIKEANEVLEDIEEVEEAVKEEEVEEVEEVEERRVAEEEETIAMSIPDKQRSSVVERCTPADAKESHG